MFNMTRVKNCISMRTDSSEADWTSAFRDYFVRVMAEGGFEDVLPSKEDVTIDGFTLEFGDKEASDEYQIVKFSDGTRYLSHLTYNKTDPKKNSDAYAEVTDELLEGLEQKIEETRMDEIDRPIHYVVPRENIGDEYFKFQIDYVSGRYIHRNYEDVELPADWPSIRDSLQEYLDTYIKDHPADPGE